VGTGRGRDRAAAPAGGAQQFADLDSERFEEVAGQVDVVLDTIGGEVLDRSAAVVRPGGMLVSVALPPKIRPVDGRAMYFVVEPNGGELAELARRVQQGRLAPPVGAVRPLAETREAFLGKQGTRQDRHKGRLIAQEPGGCCSPFPAGRVSVRQPRGTVTRHCRARVGSCL
jgi:NADPH:quinone reductase-like Zn-dependent oxidoreductase